MLELTGTLNVSVAGQDIQVLANGRHLIAEVSRPRRLIRALGPLPFARRSLQFLAATLYERGLTLTVTRNHVPFMRLGRGAEGSLVSRLVRMRHVSLFPRDRAP